MEVIKQDVNSPISVAKQVAIIYAGTNGYLDDIEPSQVRDFEAKLGDALDSTHAEWVKLFNKENAMTDEVVDGLKALLEDFKRTYGS